MISIVIPTLQKSLKTLIRLLNNLVEDDSVGEIIVIDNSLKGIDYSHQKVKIEIPEENLYVNPSWNLGVKMASFDIVGLLNDDIAIPENYCKSIAEKITPSMGILGINISNVLQVDDINSNPESEDIILEPTNNRPLQFGVAMFFYKTSYTEIPEDIKIVYGDDWIFAKCKQKKLQNYIISNQKIYHLGSISSGQKVFNPICKNDAILYKRRMIKWYQRLFSYEEHWNEYKLRLLGITFRFKKHI